MKVRSQNTNAQNKRIATQQVDVSVLKVGMKIIGIERPWSDNPTHNTGFTITSAAELEHLKSQHKTVFVDPASVRSEETEGSAPNAADHQNEDLPIVLWESTDADEEDEDEDEDTRETSVWRRAQRKLRRLKARAERTLQD